MRQGPVVNPASEKENKPLLALARHSHSKIRPLQTRQVSEGELKIFKGHVPGIMAPEVESNPLNDLINTQTFLTSPLATLTSSTNPVCQVSTHDILEAYHVFTVRLKSLYPLLSQPQHEREMIPALEPLKSHASVLVQVLRRDVERALVNPLPYSSAWSSSSHDTGFSSYQDSTAQSRIRVDLNEEEVQQAKESVSICHYALRLISFFFRFQILYQAFDEPDLVTLLQSTLYLVPLQFPLPTPNSEKTVALAIWVFKVQRLPVTVLQEVKEEVAKALRGILISGAESTVVTGDTLKACKNLLVTHSIPFFCTLSSLLPNVLDRIVSPSFDVRYKAADVLGSFCRILLDSNHYRISDRSQGSKIAHASIWDTCALQVRSFIDSHYSRKCTTPYDLRLPHVLSISLSSPHNSPPRTGSAWALHTLLTLLVLSSSTIYSPFTHPHSVKLFVTLLGEVLQNGHREVRRGGERGWMVLIWALGKLYHEKVEDMDMDMEERVFKVVKQELRGGNGEILVATLVNSRSRGASPTGSGSGVKFGTGIENVDVDSEQRQVTRALVVIEDMIQSERKSIVKIAVEILARLLSGIGSSTSLSYQAQLWVPHRTLPHALFDGTSLTDGLLTALDKCDNAFNYESVRQLTEEEVGRCWDMLVSIWQKGVEKYLVHMEASGEGMAEMCNHLIRIWQSLLLVQAQLTQGHEHLTTHTEFANRAALLVSAFLVPPLISTIKPPMSLSQYTRLIFILKLWRVMNNVFSPPWISGPTAHILKAVLRVKWLWEDELVRNAWRSLIIELAAATGMLLLEILEGGERKLIDHHAESIEIETESGTEYKLDIDLKRQLWGMVAATWKFSSWEDAVRFLYIPLGTWSMTDDEIEPWDRMLRCAIAAAATVSVQPAVVIERVLRWLGDNKVDRSSRFIDVTCIILSHLTLADATALPTDTLVMVDEILENLYPPHQRDLVSSLQLLRTLKALCLTAPSSLLVPLLKSVQKGLCIWIEDKEEVVPESEYNDVVMALYADLLVELRHQPLSNRLLGDLAPFFASSFSRIPPPALGPLAFQEFWKATYYAKQEFLKGLPTQIKVCMKAFDDVYGGDLAIGLSHDSESQSTVGSSIPDSEASREIESRVPTSSPHQLHQSTPRAVADTRSMGFDGDVRSSPISFRDAAANSSSILQDLQALTPSTGAQISPHAPQVSAFSQLRDYSSHTGSANNASSTFLNSTVLQPLRSPLPDLFPKSHSFPSRHSLKRSGEDIGETPLKRARTEPELSNLGEESKMVSGDLAGPANAVQLKRMRAVKQASIIKDNAAAAAAAPTRGNRLASVERKMSSITDNRTPSEPFRSRRRMRFDGVEVPTYQQVMNRQRNKRVSSTLSNMRNSPDDSDSAFFKAPDTEMWDTSSSGSQPTSHVSDTDIIMGSSLLMGRSHSETLPSIREHQHPPLRRARTTSSRLDVLQEAYAVVTNGASQMQVQDLVQATRLVHQIGTVLHEHIGRRFGDDLEVGDDM